MLVHGPMWFIGVCASHADELKNGGRLKYMCLQNNKEGLHVFQPMRLYLYHASLLA